MGCKSPDSSVAVQVQNLSGTFCTADDHGQRIRIEGNVQLRGLTNSGARPRIALPLWQGWVEVEAPVSPPLVWRSTTTSASTSPSAVATRHEPDAQVTR